MLSVEEGRSIFMRKGECIMQIILTKNEARKLVRIMEDVENNSSNELKEMVKGSKIIHCKPILNGSIEIIVAPEYMDEFLTVYQRYIGLFVNQVQALARTVRLFQDEVQTVVNKYI